ncbi:MAG: M23 family metallopeptidase [Anaerolineae bacterium]|jgi:murein DD-endopeptidase MepM/ murein hydrolase activator NlpD|nr:M23 family metallopeptidase [Anaerolineae bacterium]MBT7074653.1 M23 family metallopeptidase [Anaerolineae bacterium]MBT7782241.1 M23 family metallopeptidase [Anaerolineae bacterium]
MDKNLKNTLEKTSDQDIKKENSHHSERPPNLFNRWMELLLQLGLGESTLRVATNALLLIIIFLIIFFMQGFYKDGAQKSVEENIENPEISPALAIELENEALPLNINTRGIPRRAELHTTIPSRPRLEITIYTVQEGDTVFGISEQFGLSPQTILWGNYNVLLDDPHRLKAGQDLNILPVNGTYYEWQDGDGLNGVSDFFGVEPNDIIDYPTNNLDANIIGDYAQPNIAPGTKLIVPGGERAFISWSAPIGVTRENPAIASVLGDGACGAIEGGAVGYGSFVWPAANHYLSGYDWSPETNHRGIDIAGQTGMALFAADAGVIVYAGWNDYGYGNMVMIDHGTGFQTLYAHMSTLNVVCGQSVGQGEVIGAFGNTGASSGAHLHFELMHSQYSKLNPWDYLPPP